MQIHGRIGPTRTRDARAKMDVVSSVEEVGLYRIRMRVYVYAYNEKPTSVNIRIPSHSLFIHVNTPMTLYKSVYSQNSCGRADKVNRRIFTAPLGGMLFLFLCFREMQRRLRVIPRGRFGKGRVDCNVLHFIIQNWR